MAQALGAPGPEPGSARAIAKTTISPQTKSIGFVVERARAAVVKVGAASVEAAASVEIVKAAPTRAEAGGAEAINQHPALAATVFALVVAIKSRISLDSAAWIAPALNVEQK